ncbi:general substrate transporter [Mycotypha africana]|uniref:general substrate transporter n=1 Tax=Mycotypha africana TaxID=64632 RepID=UPI002300C642|nr:general substrate transporter [Mycotypha africana]KAI8984246.1 general substrate transporter [Mycotypha africana]
MRHLHTTSLVETTPLLSQVNNGVSATTYRNTVYLYSIIAAVGGLVCTYDTGSISSIIALPNFRQQFYKHRSIEYYESIILVSYLITSMCGAFISGYFCDRLGRKYTMIFASCILSMGIVFEIVGLTIKTLILGRLFAGIGTGLLTNAIPLYQSEIAPSDIRGRLISLFTLCGSFGQMIGYVVTFRTSYFHSHWSWRTPWLFQLFLCWAFILSSLCVLPLSPRWLISKGREIEGLSVLAKIHDAQQTDPIVQKDYLDIRGSIEAEKAEYNNCSYAELFEGVNLRRTIYSLFISIATCFTGNVIIWYFAPQIFKDAGLDDVSVSLALTGGIGLLSLIFTAMSLYWWIDLKGRKALFFVGSAISALCMFLVGSMFHFFAKSNNNGTSIIVTDPYARIIIIICVYAISAAFAGTWGVGNYVYTAEIFSMRCRAKGLSLTYAISWAGSIIITFSTPFLMAYSVSGVYYFFGMCSILTLVGITFIPETKGKTLEEIDFLFHNRNI